MINSSVDEKNEGLNEGQNEIKKGVAIQTISYIFWEQCERYQKTA